MGNLKAEVDLALPRTCKRARSSVHHLRNQHWEFSKRPRRSVPNAAGLKRLSEVSLGVDDQEEDLGEIALALLQMSSPNPRVRSLLMSHAGHESTSPLLLKVPSTGIPIGS